MLEWLKRLIAGKELAALDRYRQAAHLVYRWNGQVPNSAETGQWITWVGEGEIGADISGFRDALQRGEGEQYFQTAVVPRKEWRRFLDNQQGL